MYEKSYDKIDDRKAEARRKILRKSEE